MRLTHSRERGQILPLATLLIIFLLAITGLATETGMAYFTRQSAHAAAESAAMAAVLAVLPGVNGTSVSCSPSVACSPAPATCPASPSNPPVTNIDNACLYAKQNGFTNAGGTKVYVTADNTPSPPNNPNLRLVYWAQVAITTRQLQLFSALFTGSGMTAGARATAAILAPGPPSGCVYVLDPSASGAFRVAGSTLTAACGIYVNSNNNQALELEGHPHSGNVCISAPSISIVGNYRNNASCSIDPTPRTGQTEVTDPLTRLAPPTVGSCNQTNFRWSHGATSIHPGVYCGGIRIIGGTVTMQPGQYILDGGGLTIHSANATVSGSGVSFYNTATTGYSYGQLTISGQPKVTFRAPSSGPMQGIFWFTDRHDTSSYLNRIDVAAGSTIEGAIYMPNVPLVYTGEGSTGTRTALVVSRLEIHGSPNFLQDPTGRHTGLGGGAASAFLIE